MKINPTIDWREHRDAMREAMADGRCFAMPDGWCATHSTGAGPVYCEGA